MPLHEVDTRTTEQRIGTCMKLVTKNLEMVEHDPMIKLQALLNLTCLFLVTELAHLPFKQVRSQAFKLFRTSLDNLYIKLNVVRSDETKAND